MFYANDHTPIHVHVAKDGKKAKFTIFPLEMVENHGFKKQELRLIETVIEENVENIANH